MDSRNKDSLEQFYREQEENYANYANVDVQEAHNRYATVDPANNYRNEIRDSVNGQNDGCVWLLAGSGAALLAALVGLARVLVA